MKYSNIEKICIRKNFSKISQSYKIPHLLSIQIESFKKFIKNDSKKKIGIRNLLNNFFPIYNNNGNIKLQYIKHYISNSLYDYQECKNRGITYCGILKIKLKLIIFDKSKKKIKFTKIREFNMCEIPLMTKNATFVVNGVERVVVSQIHRSPGIFFESDKGKKHISKKILYSAKIVPYSGSWLNIEFDIKDILFARIDKNKKLPVTMILKALNYNVEQIIELFFNKITIDISDENIKIDILSNNLKNEIALFDIISKNKLYVKKGKRITESVLKKLKKDKIKFINIPYNFIFTRVIAKDYYNNNNELICIANMTISEYILKELKKNNYNKIEVIFTNNIDNGDYILNTLHFDQSYDRLSALIEIYHILKPGVPATLEIAEKFFENLFFSGKKYNLSEIGRLKINYSIYNKIKKKPKSFYLNKKDIILIIKKLINIKNGKEKIDDIDHLKNRRIRSVGEMINNQFYLSLLSTKKYIKEKLSTHKKKTFPKDLINFKIITILFKDFFISNPLSQFLDQNNSLSEITHKRRISALGIGGLNKECASFEVRDIHSSHYGRICPVETPEGPNIGLINSLALYSQTNRYGFLETPYRYVENGKITNKICYLSPAKEENSIIAQINSNINKKGFFIDKFVICRYNGETNLFENKKINYIDISSQQILSIGASLIPFIEHNDINRSLMGSNMHRQAIPMFITEKPLIGTGIERIIASDSGSLITAKRGGIVKYVDSKKIIIEVENKDIIFNKSNTDSYNLIKYTRSNQNTCINQTPIVSYNEKVSKGDVLADGSSTNNGELALGKNIRVAFMTWYGYNFEDSILISERVLQKDKFATIHIHELICEIKDTKEGYEKITTNIPGISKNDLLKLDKFGIIKIGSEVNEGEILVSKVTPKIEKQLKSEEKLLYAIFEKKISEYQDSSLRVPNGISGKVINIKIFKKKKKKIKNKKKYIYKEKNEKENLNYLRENIKIEINKIFKTFFNCFYELFNYNNINYKIINKIKIEKLFKFILKNNKEEKKLINLNNIYIIIIKKYIKKIKNFEKKYKDSFSLKPGILKIIKIYIATKKNIKIGDKMSGRHGNKGVVSKIIPIEDMPYDENGIPIDIILNPLGVPSRMNVGQILEVHLGMAAKQLGKLINKMLKQKKEIYKIRNFIEKIYNFGDNNIQKINFNNFNDKDILLLAKNLKNGIPIASPNFDGANEKEIKEFLKFSGLPSSGQITLYDGQTGEKFDKPITVGYMYMLKLNHLVDDKIHARSTGSYSLVTQQPLKGKAQFGGQRIGEMEVWALEAYGAAYTLQEMLTIKSDDIIGRTKIYKKIIDNKYYSEPNIPESFKVLLKEFKSLGINVELFKNK
ncbi:DNA-directed RNA polymerase subunit beta [Enterobacterales bacterium endosymbiont of Anomoneura mori]|uniref:DNA-directed RNA polymerase subunit beta n=1 Tax=Enterobacterales bacterium endosymbiont of Anomoneura mori TaxID=3132096 RepID=UPI00399D00D5